MSLCSLTCSARRVARLVQGEPNVPNLRVQQAVLPQDQRRVQGGRGNDHGGDDPSGHSQDTV